MSMKFKPKICPGCNKKFIPRSGRQVLCVKCRNEKVPCVICGRKHKRGHTDENGESICQSCYRDSKEEVDCVICGKKHKRGHTDENGEPICKTCYDSIKLKELYDSLPDGKKPSVEHLDRILGSFKKREIECWNTGKSYFLDFICVVNERANGICELSDKKSSNLEVHHLNGYNWDIDGRVDPNNAICIDKAVHKAFHRIYGYGDNTMEQWLEFASNYEKRSATLDDWM